MPVFAIGRTISLDIIRGCIINDFPTGIIRSWTIFNFKLRFTSYQMNIAVQLSRNILPLTIILKTITGHEIEYIKFSRF